MLRLPCGVEPTFGLGSFFVAQKMRNVSIPQIQLYRSILFLNEFKIKWLPPTPEAPADEPAPGIAFRFQHC